MEDALPTPPGEVAQPHGAAEPEDTVPIECVSLNPLDALRLVAKPISKPAKARARAEFIKRSKKWGFKVYKKKLQRKYSVRKNFLLRKTVVPESMLAKAIARDQELKRLRKLMDAPRKAITEALRKRWIERAHRQHQPRLDALMEQAKPVVHQLCLIDRKIQNTYMALEYAIYCARLQEAPQAKFYLGKYKARMEKIRQGLALQVASTERKKLLAKHGVWQLNDPTNKPSITLEKLQEIKQAEEIKEAKKKESE